MGKFYFLIQLICLFELLTMGNCEDINIGKDPPTQLIIYITLNEEDISYHHNHIKINLTG